MKSYYLNKIAYQLLCVIFYTCCVSIVYSFNSLSALKLSKNTSVYIKKGYKKIVTSNKRNLFCSITPGVIAANLPIADCESINPTATINVVSATGDGVITYQWQSSIDNIIFTNIIGATNSTYAYVGSGLTITTYFRRVATSTVGAISCSAFSNTLTYTVYPIPSVASILPGGTSNVCVGNTLQFTNATPGGVWSSNDATIASISPTGLVTGVSAGTLPLGIHYTVTNSYGCSKAANKTIHVNATPATILIYHN